MPAMARQSAGRIVSSLTASSAAFMAARSRPEDGPLLATSAVSDSPTSAWIVSGLPGKVLATKAAGAAAGVPGPHACGRRSRAATSLKASCGISKVNGKETKKISLKTASRVFSESSRQRRPPGCLFSSSSSSTDAKIAKDSKTIEACGSPGSDSVLSDPVLVVGLVSLCLPSYPYPFSCPCPFLYPCPLPLP